MREMTGDYKTSTLLYALSVLFTVSMVFKRYTHTTAAKKSVVGPYSGLAVPKRKIVKNRSYFMPAEENDDLPYAYVDSSDEMGEPTPISVSKKRGKKRASTSKKSHPIKKRRCINNKYKDEDDDDDDDDDDVMCRDDDDEHDDDDDEEEEEGENEEEVEKSNHKKRHVHKIKKKIKSRPVITKPNESDEENDSDSHVLEFKKPKKMTVSMKLKQAEQKRQKVEESEEEEPEVVVKKLNNLGSVINDKQSASVLDLKNTDISLLSSTLKGVLDAQLPEIPGMGKEELKRFCLSKTTLKEKRRMLMDSQFLTPIGKYLSLLEIDN